MSEELYERWRRSRAEVARPEGFPAAVMARVRARGPLREVGPWWQRALRLALAMPAPAAALAGFGLVIGLGRMTVLLVLLLLTTGKGF